jgi:hypothetical protein
MGSRQISLGCMADEVCAGVRTAPKTTLPAFFPTLRPCEWSRFALPCGCNVRRCDLLLPVIAVRLLASIWHGMAPILALQVCCDYGAFRADER